jgi:hypothetical protein
MLSLSRSVKRWLVCGGWFWWTLVASAHEIRPAIATFTTTLQGAYAITISLNLEALIAGIGPEHDDTNTSPNAERYNELRQLPPAELQSAFAAFHAELLAGIQLRFDGQRVAPAFEPAQIPAAGEGAHGRAPLLARISEFTLRGEVPAGADTVTWQWAAEFGAIVFRVPAEGAREGFSAWLENGAKSDPIVLTELERPGAAQRLLDALGF